MQPISLPGFSSSAAAFQSVSVSFKAVEGVFDYYDFENKKSVQDTTMDGIIIGTGFQYSALIGKPTSKKSVSYSSSIFGWDALNEGKIKIYKKTRIAGQDAASEPIGEKTAKEWKEAGYKMAKVVFFLDPTDKETIYRLVASGRSFFNLNKLIKPDAPNFIMTFKPSEKPVETDNGDFYDLEVVKKENISPDDGEMILEKVIMINNYVNKIKPITLAGAQEMFDDKTPDVQIEDLPF